HQELVIHDPTFQALGEAEFLGIPAALLLLVGAALFSILLWRRETFWPLASVSTRRWLTRLQAPANIMWSFAISGVLGGLAGVFIAACGVPIASPMGHVTWILAPMAAAILGGGVVVAGMGSTWTALSGAAALALAHFFLDMFHVPITGPIASGMILFVLLLGGRLLALNWYEIQELRRGNLLGIPGAQRLPQVLFKSRYAPAIWAGVAAMLTIGAYGYVSYYVVQYVPENAAIVASVEGDVHSRHYDRVFEEWKTEKVEAKMLLEKGYTVETGQHSWCLLKLSDGSIVRVSDNASMTLREITEKDDGTRNVSFHVTIGRVLADVKKMVTPESKFEVETPMLTVAVRGTTFEVDVEQERAVVGVIDGALSMFRYFTGTDEYGRSQMRPEGGKILGGQGVTAWVDRPLTSPYPIPAFQENRIKSVSDQAAAEVARAFVGYDFLKGLAGALLVGIAVYLSFLWLAQQPSRIVTEEEVREAARRLEQTRTGGADDSSRSAAIVQMLMRVGKKDEARKELENMVDADPQSEYGSWAQRMLSRFRDEEPEEDDESEDEE
ncbi:MAG: FecR domain-containing protein, partial [Armatimonadota bacterium]